MEKVWIIIQTNLSNILIDSHAIRISLIVVSAYLFVIFPKVFLPIRVDIRLYFKCRYQTIYTAQLCHIFRPRINQYQ